MRDRPSRSYRQHMHTAILPILLVYGVRGARPAYRPEYLKCYCTTPDDQGVSSCSDFKGATCNVSCDPIGPCSCSLSTAQPEEHAVHLGGPVYLCQTNAPPSQTAYIALPLSQAHVQSAPTLSGKTPPGFATVATPPASPPGKLIPPNAGLGPCYCTATGYDFSGGGTYACFDLDGNACSSSSMPSGSCTLTNAYNRKLGIKWGGPVYKCQQAPLSPSWEESRSLMRQLPQSATGLPMLPLAATRWW